MNTVSYRAAQDYELRPVLVLRKNHMELFARTSELITRTQIFHVCQYSELPSGIKQWTFYNLWRIEFSTQGMPSFFEHSPRNALWKKSEIKSFDFLKHIAIWPIKTNCFDRKEILSYAIWKIINNNDSGMFPRWANKTHTKKKYRKHIKGMIQNPRGLLKYYTGFFYTKLCRAMNPGSMMAGEKALRKVFWKHIVDREVLSAAITAHKIQEISLRDYIWYVENKAGLLKVAKEHRNLLPLLYYINPAYWDKDDLFSRTRWVRDGRLQTSVDSADFSQYAFIQSFETQQEWRWVKNLSSKVLKVCAWEEINIKLIKFMSSLNISQRVPVEAYRIVFKDSCFEHLLHITDIQIKALMRLYLLHVSNMWSKDGYRKTFEYIRKEFSYDLNQTWDYLLFSEKTDLLEKKNTTWVTLKNRSDIWHQELQNKREKEEYEKYKHMQWSSAISEIEMNGYRFVPLQSHDALCQEGQEMQHCVSSYSSVCFKNQYRVFSVCDQQGQRSTLGLHIEGKSVHVNQHYGQRNQKLDEQTLKAGQELARHYEDALIVQSQANAGNKSKKTKVTA